MTDMAIELLWQFAQRACQEGKMNIADVIVKKVFMIHDVKCMIKKL